MYCFSCPSSYSTRQGLETHLIRAKKKCYTGPLPQGFTEYCETNKRSYCGPCNKLFAKSETCPHCKAPIFLGPNQQAESAEMRNEIETPQLEMAPEEIQDEEVDPCDVLKYGLRAPVLCLTCVPFKAVRVVADAYNRILRKVIGAPASIEAHVRLLLFTPFVLAVKSEKKKKQWIQVKERARQYIDLPLQEIARTIEQNSRQAEPRVVPKGPSMKAVKKLVSLGRYSDAVKMLSSEGVHPTTPDIIKTLQEKHPIEPPMESINPTPQFVGFSTDQVQQAINSFTNGSSGGPFALVERMIKDLVAEPQIGTTILGSLAEYCSIFVTGKFPAELAPFYSSARLIPLVKKDGGVRPMAVGETLRRLACKLALMLIVDDMPPVFLPQQLGVGTPNGAESIIHSVAEMMENLADDEAILQVDFTNAFNLVSRTVFMRLVQEHFPQIWNLVNYLYSCQGYLRIGQSEEMILSCSGVQQGCPFATLLFALVLRELTMRLSVETPALKLNKWFADDGHLVGKVADLTKCLEIIVSAEDELGLKLNLKKCVVKGANVNEFPAEILRATGGLNVLGAPIGTDEFVRATVREQIYKAAVDIFKTRDLNDPQMEMLLLRCCTGAPKSTYWLRTCVPSVIKGELEDFDRAIDRALQHILGVPVYGQDRLTVHLPLSMGGLGIPIASISSDAAFVASIGSSWNLQPNLEPRIGFNEARLRLVGNGSKIPVLSTKFTNDVSPQITQQKEFSQRNIMLTVNKKMREEISADANIKKNVIMTGRSCKGASYWLTTPPNTRNNTTIEASSFRTLIKYSIGLPQFSGTHKCPDCGKEQDKFGHHALSCKVASGSIDKHNSIVNGIYKQLKQASITCSSEAFNPMKDNRERPGDIYMPEFDVYGDAFFDVSVISICANSYVSRAAKGQLEGSKIRYVQKMAKYPDLGTRFKPLVIESTGGWHPYSFDYLKTLADHIAAKTNKTARDALNGLLTTSAFCLQRHQGTMLVRRCLGLE